MTVKMRLSLGYMPVEKLPVPLSMVLTDLAPTLS